MSNEWYAVGEFVEYIGTNTKDSRCYDEWIEGDKIEVIALRNVGGEMLPIVFNLRHESASAMMIEYLRPIKSDREKAIEAGVEVISNARLSVMDGNALYIGALYDAGLLRLPEDK